MFASTAVLIAVPCAVSSVFTSPTAVLIACPCAVSSVFTSPTAVLIAVASAITFGSPVAGSVSAVLIAVASVIIFGRPVFGSFSVSLTCPTAVLTLPTSVFTSPTLFVIAVPCAVTSAFVPSTAVFTSPMYFGSPFVGSFSALTAVMIWSPFATAACPCAFTAPVITVPLWVTACSSDVTAPSTPRTAPSTAPTAVFTSPMYFGIPFVGSFSALIAPVTASPCASICAIIFGKPV